VLYECFVLSEDEEKDEEEDEEEVDS